MRKKGRPRKPSPSPSPSSPPPQPPPPPALNSSGESPKSFDFNLHTSPRTATAAFYSAGRSPRRSVSQFPASISPQGRMNITSMSELKEMASSRLDAIKRQSDRSHSDIVKEIESSRSRLQKRFKIQTNACQQLTDEADTELKKMTESISESWEALKASYAELMAEAQSSASRVCKTSIPELAESYDKAIDALRRRHGISPA